MCAKNVGIHQKKAAGNDSKCDVLLDNKSHIYGCSFKEETPEAAHPYRPIAGYSFHKMVADEVIFFF